MAFARPKKREPVGEAGLFEYAVGTLARRMRTVRDLRRLMKTRAEEGEAGERAMDAVIVRLKELNYLSDTRFAEDYTRVRKEHEKFGKRRVQQDLMMKGVEKELVASTLESAYEDVDEVGLARQYIARKRMRKPSGESAQKETVRTMNRLMRAGFSSNAIFKVLKAWELPEEALAGVEEGGVDSDSYAEREERAGDSDSYAKQNEEE
ncbi:regulatory protein RecX [Tunturiibacter gelidoferens]|uniref:Regulatory protein RecX n=1 Tax=Tunturiibacter lichenicola TaxID=2051959 RepID=A0A7Y9NJU4_9BACT|nr:regulatory protein RecX [Edaphobacter lichenicola]NYF50492.1 regulatory protein [Edaphobacter lichenicola]